MIFNNKLDITRKFFIYAFSIMILILFIDNMWDFSVTYSEDRAISIEETFVKAAPWLSENLEEQESAIIPMPDTFWAIEPSLKNKTKIYKSFWDELEIIRINSTETEKNKVRQSFSNYVTEDNNKIKYIVIAWSDKFMKATLDITAKNLNSKKICDKINLPLTEAKRFSFVTPHSHWKSHLVICQVVKANEK